jgi:uncharacterized repeat protein (TIGR03943 family)
MSASAHPHDVGAVRAAGRSGLSPGRVGMGMVIASWAGLFWFLLLTGRSSLYLSTRTSWVVPLGAVLLTAAAIGRLGSARVASPGPLSRSQLWLFSIMVVPVVITIASPPGALNSYAADRRGNFVRAGFSASAEDIAAGELSLLDVAGAQTSKEGQRALAARAGETVSFLGFVALEEDTRPDEFLLTRFIVSCCVADATVAQVRVVNVPPGRFAEDQWVRVSGTIYPIGREVIVDSAGGVESASQPDPPYLSP